MAKYVSDNVMDKALDETATATQENVCSAQPATVYEGMDPDDWAASTAYSLGDAVKPTTRNGYAYEATAGGTSDSSEPSWPTTAGNTVVDGTVTWTCRNNYALATETLAGGDFTKANGDTDGRKVTVAQQAGVSVHTNGTGSHVSLVDKTNLELHAVTTISNSQALTSGNTVTINAFAQTIRDAT